jgi:hypothetical protein
MDSVERQLGRPGDVVPDQGHDLGTMASPLAPWPPLLESMRPIRQRANCAIRSLPIALPLAGVYLE